MSNKTPLPVGATVTYTTSTGLIRTAAIAYWYRHPASNKFGAVLTNGETLSGLDTGNVWLGGGNAQPVTLH